MKLSVDKMFLQHHFCIAGYEFRIRVMTRMISCCLEKGQITFLEFD